MRKINWSDKAALTAVVNSSITKSEVLKTLGITCTMGNYLTLEKWCRIHQISIAHFTPNKSRTSKLLEINSKWTLETACTENSLCNRSIVKRLILSANSIEYTCRDCGISGEWNGKPITLQLEHINGMNDDHRLENLCFLCPNCHSQTSTYAGRNAAPSTQVRTVSLETKRAKEQAKVDATSARILSLLQDVPEEMFHGWGAKKKVAVLIGIPQGKLLYYIKHYAPEYESKFTK